VSTQTTQVEIVRFMADGLTEAAAQTKSFGRQIDEATKSQKVLSGLMNSASYQRFERQLAGVTRQSELMGLRMRNTAAEMARLDGSAAKFMASAKKLNAQHEISGMKVRNAAMASGLADGSETKRVRTVERLNEQYARMQARAEAVAKYGERWGAVMHKYGGALHTAGRVGIGIAGAGVATATGLAYQGFSGTVELGKMQTEMQMLSREVAGVFKPLMTVMTKATRVTRKRLEHTDRSEQRTLMWGGVGLAGLTGARILGIPVAGPTMFLLRRAGAVGGGSGTAAMGLKRAGVAGAVGYTLYDSGRDIATDPSTTRGLGRQSVRSFDMFFGGEGFRAMGYKSGGPLGQLYDGIFGSNESNPRNAPPAASAPGAGPAVRNMVTLAGGGWEESGQLFERLTTAIAKTEGEEDTSEEALGPVLKLIYDLLVKIEAYIDRSSSPVPAGPARG
jgi:hypothetical protein